MESASPLFIFVITMLQLPSKRVMDGPSFDVHRAESSHQHVMAGPASLDPRRAEAASKHVRALNTQFARCVPSPAGLVLLLSVETYTLLEAQLTNPLVMLTVFLRF